MGWDGLETVTVGCDGSQWADRDKTWLGWNGLQWAAMGHDGLTMCGWDRLQWAKNLMVAMFMVSAQGH